MDPIVSLHYYAPVCAVINACIIPFTEGLAPFMHLGRLGAFVLFTNAGIAFALNVSHARNGRVLHDGLTDSPIFQVSAVFLISVGSGLILTLAGVFKDIVSYAREMKVSQLLLTNHLSL